MVSSGGDPMVFIPLKDAQEAQFLKDNDAIVQSRAAPPPTRPSTGPACPGCWTRCIASQTTANPMSTPCWCAAPRRRPRRGGESVRRWQRLTVYTRAQMEGILVGKLIATSARQIGMFLMSSWRSSARPSSPSSSTR
jgi:putative ABC transport system permease protein